MIFDILRGQLDHALSRGRAINQSPSAIAAENLAGAKLLIDGTLPVNDGTIPMDQLWLGLSTDPDAPGPTRNHAVRALRKKLEDRGQHDEVMRFITNNIGGSDLTPGYAFIIESLADAIVGSFRPPPAGRLLTSGVMRHGGNEISVITKTLIDAHLKNPSTSPDIFAASGAFLGAHFYTHSRSGTSAPALQKETGLSSNDALNLRNKLVAINAEVFYKSNPRWTTNLIQGIAGLSAAYNLPP